MHSCPHCDRDDFRSRQGLSGHIRMVHNGAETTPDLEPERRLLFGREIPDDPEPRSQEVVQEMVKQMASAWDDAGRKIGERADALTQKLIEQKALVLKEFQNAVHVGFLQAGQALRTNLAQALTHHLCSNTACVSCKPTIAAIRADTLDKIEDRVPGTLERLEDYEALNTPI